jgi:glucose/arabinose dehydrogenase
MKKYLVLLLAGAGAALLLVVGITSNLSPEILDSAVDEARDEVRDLALVRKLNPSRGKYHGPPCKDEKDAKPGQPKPYCGDLPSLAAVNIREVKLETISEEFQRPWAFEFISDSEVLVTEFKGKLKRLDTSAQKSTSIKGLPKIVPGKGQAGLLDVALHPAFDDNRLVYFSHAVADSEERYALAVSRGELLDDNLRNVEQIFLGEPWVASRSNFGGALLFDREGYLFVTVGDRSLRSHSQHPGLLLGKVVRLNDDGSVPDDNPFTNQPGTHHPAIYALGVRNPQGLVQDPDTRHIYEAEHGPMGGDEVNRIEPGNNYGWPIISYGLNYVYRLIGEGTVKEGLEQPLFYYLPSLAISPLEIYRGEMFPEWHGDLLVGAMKDGSISKLDLHDGRILSESKILSELNARIRDIKVAPDSSLWVLVETGKLYRLSREANPIREKLEVGKRDGDTIYLTVCSNCHDRNVAGVPQLADKAAWAERREKSAQELYKNTIEGYNSMPERGLCEDCTDEELIRSVNFMLKMLKK